MVGEDLVGGRTVEHIDLYLYCSPNDVLLFLYTLMRLCIPLVRHSRLSSMNV